jgi:hypothetical protein
MKLLSLGHEFQAMNASASGLHGCNARSMTSDSAKHNRSFRLTRLCTFPFLVILHPQSDS